MGFFDFLNPLMNFIFGPLLYLPPLLAVVLISFLLSLLITVVYKYTTDQNLMKQMKTEMKELQTQMKTMQQHPEKMKEAQGKFMQINGKFMMESMKPTLFYFIPIILIFGWLNANMAFEPLMPGQEFTATLALDSGVSGNISIDVPAGISVVGEKVKQANNGHVIYTLKGNEGDYLVSFDANGKRYDKELIVSNSRKYAEVVKTINDKTVKTITLSNKPTNVINLFGFQLGWLGTYILSSILFGMGLRKLMKVY